MVGRCHLGVSARDGALAIDEIADAGRMLLACIRRRAVSDAHGFVNVTEQIKWKSELVAERLVFSFGIAAYAEDHRVVVSKLLDSITEPFAFDGSPRGVGFGVPPEQDVLAFELIERDRLPILIREGKARRLRILVKDRHEQLPHVEPGATVDEPRAFRDPSARALTWAGR